MLTTLSALALTYAAGTGAFTNLAVIGRGLVRATEQLFEGDYPRLMPNLWPPWG